MKKSIRAKLDAPIPIVPKAQRRPGAPKYLDAELKAAAPAERRDILSLERMMALRVSGLTYNEVGKIMGCSEENVVKRLTPYRDTIDGLREFQDNKADLYDVYQSRILSGIDDQKIKEAKLFDLIRSSAQLEDMSRKVKGLDATKNVNVFSLTIKAAYPVPEKKGNVIEGIQDSVRGTGVPEVVREGELQEVSRDREPWSPDPVDHPRGSVCVATIALPVHEAGEPGGAGRS
jgi:hypothetical protein